MVTTENLITTPQVSLDCPVIPQSVEESFASKRLTSVFTAATEIAFNNRSRLVFFSDCHRGDNSKADAFAVNKALYLKALRHYHRQGFTYIEVGDGDEMWKNRKFRKVLHAHPRVFELLHQFDDDDRLHIIVGNHDIPSNRKTPVTKDGIIAKEGILLRHGPSGRYIFTFHGHQADFISDRIYRISRFAVRQVWRRLQLAGIGKAKYHPVENYRGTTALEARIKRWMQNAGVIVVCGHTHRPKSADYTALPYFNTGSCVVPRVLTGLEFQDGELRLVRWTASRASHQEKPTAVKRELIAPPRKLSLLA